jgi:hypothetical protein
VTVTLARTRVSSQGGYRHKESNLGLVCVAY